MITTAGVHIIQLHVLLPKTNVSILIGSKYWGGGGDLI